MKTKRDWIKLHEEFCEITKGIIYRSYLQIRLEYYKKEIKNARWIREEICKIKFSIGSYIKKKQLSAVLDFCEKYNLDLSVVNNEWIISEEGMALQ